MSTIKVPVQFTVEVDPDQYRAAFGVDNTNADVRQGICDLALEALRDVLGESDVAATEVAWKGGER